jgi:hypothetical protein
MVLELRARAHQSEQVTRRWLYRSDDQTAFAYAHGHDLIRRSDETLWAHVSDGVLLSARSGEPLAYQARSLHTSDAYGQTGDAPLELLELADVDGDGCVTELGEETRAARAVARHEELPSTQEHDVRPKAFTD